ncbi:MAG: amino acid racemase [Candidatus Paceibacterota bacterium]
MKTLGILGGVGPQTTSKIYLSIIDLIRKNGKDKYPSILIYNLPFPFIIENEAIIQGVNSEKMIPYLINGAKILEKAGADFGILPCNTLHKYISKIRKSVKFSFLSILEEVVLTLKSKKIKTVGILATKTTIQSKIYESILQKNKIKILYPSQIEQKIINNIIVELLNGKKNKLHSQKVKKICDSLQEKGAENILLACTDLQLVITNINSSIPIVDTTDILIQASVRELLKK